MGQNLQRARRQGKKGQTSKSDRSCLKYENKLQNNLQRARRQGKNGQTSKSDRSCLKAMRIFNDCKVEIPDWPKTADWMKNYIP